MFNVLLGMSIIGLIIAFIISIEVTIEMKEKPALPKRKKTKTKR